MAEYPSLVRYLNGGMNRPLGRALAVPALTAILPLTASLVVGTGLTSLLFLLIYVVCPIVSTVTFYRLSKTHPRWWKGPGIGGTGSVSKLSEGDWQAMDRGTGAWFRILTFVEGPLWMGPEIPASRRSVAGEVRELAEEATRSLVHEPMSPEDRAWLAFGLERLADEVQRPLDASIDHIGYAIHNRQALRLAHHLAKNRTPKSLG